MVKPLNNNNRMENNMPIFNQLANELNKEAFEQLQIEFNNFKELVLKTRKAQNKYFKNGRLKYDLQDAKNLEQKLDKYLAGKTIGETLNAYQSKLF